MIPIRTGILDMFVLYINNKVAKGNESDKLRTRNLITLLTCETYLLFDDRTEDERARENIKVIIDRLKNLAYKECNDLIDRLAKEGNRQGLKKLHDRLAQNQCKARLAKILSVDLEEEINGENSKIKI